MVRSDERGAIVGLLVRAMSPGLRLFMSATDAVATKVVQPRG